MKKKTMSKKHLGTKPPKAKSQETKPTNYIPAFVALLILAGFIGYGVTQTDSDSGVLVPQATVTAANPSIHTHSHDAHEVASAVGKDPRVKEVASYFRCGCGNCDDPELSTCQCPMAKGQREFIQKQLEEGKGVDTVRFLVYKTYGYEKPQFTEQFQSVQ